MKGALQHDPNFAVARRGLAVYYLSTNDFVNGRNAVGSCNMPECFQAHSAVGLAPHLCHEHLRRIILWAAAIEDEDPVHPAQLHLAGCAHLLDLSEALLDQPWLAQAESIAGCWLVLPSMFERRPLIIFVTWAISWNARTAARKSACSGPFGMIVADAVFMIWSLGEDGWLS